VSTAIRQQAAVAAIIELGGNNLPWVGLWYDDDLADPDYAARSPEQRSFLTNCVDSVVEVSLFQTSGADRLLNHVGKLRSLRRVVIEDTDASERGVEYLTACRELRYISFRGSFIGDSGLIPLARLRKLETLDLVGTHVTDSGLESLTQMSTLRDVYLSAPVSPCGVTYLQHRLPECSIHY
jgi:hypothetical protein